jgi:protein SCO1/2
VAPGANWRGGRVRPLPSARAAGICVLVGTILLAGSPASAQETPGSIGQRVGFDQRLGEQIPLGARFRDEAGRDVALGEYLGKRPVILTLAYYNCPLLCTQVLNGVTRCLKPLSIGIGKDFDIVTVSIDPTERPALAAAKKSAYLGRYDRPGPEPAAGWHFLTGETPAIEALARSVGFRYSYNPRTKLYAHAAGMVVLSPTGRISRYFYGLDYSPKDVQFALKEASSEKVGLPISRVLLLCYDYDAATGKYTLSILRVLRLAAIATALGVASFMAFMFWRERRDSSTRTVNNAATGTTDFSTS